MVSGIKKAIAVLAVVLVLPMFVSTAHAQKPNSMFSASALGGLGTSSLGGSSQYMALRGSLGSYYAEVRRVKWGVGGSSDMVDETSGILVGYSMSISQIVLSGGAGLAQVNYTPVNSTTTSSYSALGYEVQGVYNVPLALGAVNLGVGANYSGETSGTVSPNGWGAIAELSVGF